MRSLSQEMIGGSAALS